jgi:LCP family protein required for cell wall assembly
VLTAGYGAYKYYKTQAAIQVEVGGVDKREDELEPFNALLVGSDSRGDLTEEEQHDLGAAAVSGERADTIILAHIDPGANRVTMVQFPRDLYVPVAGGGEDKINAALMGGPDALVKTIKDLTGLTINQYVQVNIAGFRDLVDAIGGVELCITEPIPFDPQTGIEITPEEVGMVRFDGDRALRFVRSRNFETGDFARIQNQQKFVAAAINKITSSSTLINPGRLNKLADVAGENLKTDKHTTILGLRSLAGRLRSFDPKHYEAYVIPNLGIGAIDGASVVLPDDESMQVLFKAIADNESPATADGVPDIEPSSVTVGVYDTTANVGAASGAANALVEATGSRLKEPVQLVTTGTVENRPRAKTLVLWDPQQPASETKAELIAAAIPGAVVREGEPADGIDVAVIVGTAGFETKRLIQITPIELPEPGAPPPACR